MDVIRISGARQHNLRNLTLEIPKNQLVVITGMSGSGKSSLAFDTLFAEGQRKYVESLSAYARQFLDQLQKPDVDFIEGLSPAIAIEQRTSATNPRSTIATTTEIYDYLRLLFSSIGVPHDPQTGEVVKKLTLQQIVDQVLDLEEGSRIILLSPLVDDQTGEFRDVLEKARREGFVRVRIDGEIMELDTPEPIRLDRSVPHRIEVVVDRLVIRKDIRERLNDSMELALRWGRNRVIVLHQTSKSDEGWTEIPFSTDFLNPKTGFALPKLTPRHFSFNSHLGACPVCQGLGTQLVSDPELIVPDPTLSLEGGAIRPWAKAGKKMGVYYKALLNAVALAYSIDPATPFQDLPAEVRQCILYGSKSKKLPLPGPKGTVVQKPFEGVIPQMERLYLETESELSKKRIRAYMGRAACEACHGKRLKPEILTITIKDTHGKSHNIDSFCRLPVQQAWEFVTNLQLSKMEEKIVHEVVREIVARTGFLREVGLGYLALNRESGTLSGGEAQRIRLATQIGSGLSGVIYVLDEPSIGLHQRDNDNLIRTLKRLRDLGNSVIVVEHDEDTIRSADYIIDMGPSAGPHGGEIVGSGTLEALLNHPEKSLTAKFLTGEAFIPVPSKRIPPKTSHPVKPQYVEKTPDSGWIGVTGAQENNLKNIHAFFPLGCMTCVTGVSGSGKSTLVDTIFRRALQRRLHGGKLRPGKHEKLLGAEQIDKVIVIDQAPIGRTPRSNPVTYTGAFGAIRDLFAQRHLARVRGYDVGRFSYNVKGGRCEACQGDGMLRIEMHFLADVYVECEVCSGHRYNRETLEVTYKGRNIADVLEMTVDEATGFFRNIPGVADKLDSLHHVGLGYLKLGQSATTLSGGEAQRIKLAAELARKATGNTVYILDEPTTGLHFADIHKLLEVLMKLRNTGNSLVIIEHNLEVIKCADWIIDLGPEGGEAGGNILFEGTPEKLLNCTESATARYLKRYL